MANNLIIGLGGTGGAILAELRKRIYAETGKKNYTGDVTIDYLYVDSSEEDLNNKSNWTYLGTPLHLSPSQKVSIHGMGSGVLSNTHNYPGMEAFLPEKDRQLLQNDQVMSIISAGIGGQRRRFGRMLIANNIGTRDSDSSFVSRLKDKIVELTANGEGTIDFHICAGLAGGTGSGSFVDVVAQINKVMEGMAVNSRNIYCYLYIPEVLVDSKHDAGFYHANGYAALSELNAMLLNKYCPTDVSGENDVETQKVRRLIKTGLPINSAYIFSNMNEAARVLPKGKKLSAAVADFLYQKLLGDITQRLEDAENSGVAPEKDAAGNRVHAQNFLTFGIKRIEYPETEIKEFITYCYAIQAARQLEYNTWVDGKGYETISIDEIGLGYKAEIGKKETLEGLKLSDSYLTLQTPIKNIKGVTDSWENFVNYWETITNFFADDATEDSEKRNWPSNFLTSCEMEYHSNFRGVGVKKFFETQRSETRGYAAYIRRHIEEKLFGEWLSGEKSLLEVEKFVQILIDNTSNRIADLDNKISNNRDYIEKEINLNIADIENEWNNIGWLRDAITGASRKVFDKYKAAKCEYYVTVTEIESFEFAKILIQELLSQFNSLLISITDFKSVLNVVLKKVGEEAESKCQIQTITQKTEVNVLDKKYNPEAIRMVAKEFIRDITAQQNNSRQVREAMAAFLSADDRNFSALYNNLNDIDILANTILGVCNRNAVDIMQNVGEKDPQMKMLNVNILEKIKQEYNTEELLEQYVHNIVKETKVFTQFDQEEIAKGTLDPTSGRQLIRFYQLCLPEYNDPTNFRDRFIEMFAAQCPGFNRNDVVVSNKESQITVIAAASVIPLRFIQNLKFMEKKYKEVTGGPLGELNKVLLHTETFSKPLPPLFEASALEKEKERRPYAILLHSLGVIEQQTDPETGAAFNALGVGSGFSRQYLRLGKHMDDTLQILIRDEVTNNTVMEYVDGVLASDYRTNDARGKLRNKIEETVCAEILPLCKNNMLDPLFEKYRKAAEELFRTSLADR